MFNKEIQMYTIKSKNALAKVLGKTVAKDSDFTYDQLRKYISVKNIVNIISDYSEVDDLGEDTISRDGITCVMADIFDWLVGRELATMAANDMLDCYWDDHKNEMIFKAKPEE